MRNVMKILLVLMAFCFPKLAHADALNSCECPKLSCNTECEVEQDLSFYSEKCDNGQRVRSCSRPTCVPMQNAPAHCANPQAAKPVEKPAVVVGDSVEDMSRTPASAEPAMPGKRIAIGKVQHLEGAAHKMISDKEKKVLKMNDEVFEKDRIVTTEDGKVQIRFESGNFLNITPNSEIVIAEASDSLPSAEKKRMVLDLIRGKIRNKVEKKYEGNEQSHYRVRTKAAVAGVRGTDFAVSFEPENENMVSKIETLEGKVELSDTAFEKKTYVAQNEGATFVIPKAALFNEREVAAFKKKGYLTPVYKMNEKQIETLQKETGFAQFVAGAPYEEETVVAKATPKVRKTDAPICAGPEGALNQCSWTCENNPAGDKRCRTDLPSVSCVRRICNANGQWSQPTRLPAAYHESCLAEKPVVKSCDY